MSDESVQVALREAAEYGVTFTHNRESVLTPPSTSDMPNEIRRLKERVAALETALAGSLSEKEYWKKQALTDDLTQSANRKHLLDTLNQTIQHYQNSSAANQEQGNEDLRRSSGNKGFALGFIDLDHFKTINDTFGHEAGDLVLQRVADYLKDALRQNDVISVYNRHSFAAPPEQAGRLGGDEFVLVLQNANSDTIDKRAHEIEKGLNNLVVDYNGTKIHVSGTLGVVNCDLNFSAEENLRLADHAMMLRKQSRKSMVLSSDALFTAAEQSTVPQRLNLC